MENLTKKQQGFVKDYLETGNATEAVKNNYDVTTDLSARVIGSQNLTKTNIIEAIQSIHTPEVLNENHLKLFKQRQVEYFMFPKDMADDEIIGHVKAAGIDVITIRKAEKGKMAFYSIPDANAIKNGLDMAYKITGAYAPEKSIKLNITAEQTPEVIEKAKLFDAWLKNNTMATV